jgi:hypothetical protein
MSDETVQRPSQFSHRRFAFFETERPDSCKGHNAIRTNTGSIFARFGATFEHRYREDSRRAGLQDQNGPLMEVAQIIRKLFSFVKTFSVFLIRSLAASF